MPFSIRSAALFAFVLGSLLTASAVRADEGTVTEYGTFLLQIRTPVPGMSVAQRAAQVKQRLEPLLVKGHLTPSNIKLVPTDGRCINLLARGRLVITVTPEDGKANHMTTLQQARIWLKSLRKNLPELQNADDVP